MIAAAAPLSLSLPRPSHAQDQQPDLQMLLNLDLFGKAAAGQTGSGGDSQNAQSLLDQIRTLDAMGYLGAKNPQAAPTSSGADSPPPVQPDSSAEPE